MIQDTTSATPRLDWLRNHLILALQELQGWVDLDALDACPHLPCVRIATLIGE